MRFLSPALALLCSLLVAGRATDFPTIKTPLPDVPIAFGSAVSPVDLRNHFEITSITGQVVQFRTTMGNYNLELRADAAPATVANFLVYVNGGRFAQTIVHRSDKGLGVIQGGGYGLPTLARIATDPPIALEYNLPNARGTIAMARTSAQNSATSEWFINTDDNSIDLGASNGGGYAVFGRVTGTGMSVVDTIAALPVYAFQSPFGQLPLTGYTAGNNVQEANLVVTTAAEAIPLFPAQAGQNAVVTFSASSSNTGIAGVVISGSSLSVTPVAGQSGFTDITVTATDTNGNAVQDTFRLTIAAGIPEITVEQPAGSNVADGASRSFPLTHTGSAADLVFTVKNTGSGNLALTGTPRVAIDGPDAAQFSVIALPAAIVAGPNGSTTFTVRFVPTGSGARTAALHIANDDSDENPFDITLNGTANVRPALTLPASPVVVEATGPGGATATFDVTASDEEDGTLTPTVTPSSGSAFPIGDTTVQVSATDSAGGVRAGSFTVRVRDTTAPQIDGTFSPLVLASDRAGKATLPDFTTQATTSDAVGVTSVTQEPAAGTLLADGTTSVTLTARDAAGNSAATSFDVTVAAGTTVLLAKGGTVPGAGVDPRIPAGAKWSTFGIPSIALNSAPEAGWLSTVTVSATSSFSGIFSGPLGAPVLRLRTGETATDGAGAAVTGVKFASFRTPVFAGGDFATLATVSGTRVASLVNDTGLWVNAGGTLRGIARAGAAAPGAAAAKFLAITAFAMPAPGTVFFTGKLVAPLTKDTGLWRWTSADGTQLVLREGTPIDIGAGPQPLLSFRTLGGVAGSPGHARYDSTVPAIDVLLTFTNGSTAIGTVTPDGMLHVTRRSGTTDGANRVLKNVGVPSSPGAGLDATAIAMFTPDTALGITTANNRAVFDFETDTIIAQTGIAAPGAGTAKFFAFKSPVTGGGTTAFGATLSGSTPTRDTGLWRHTAAGGLALLAREGALPPGAPGTKWLSFSSLALLDGRGPMFTARLLQTPPTVTIANDLGFWATDSTGTLRLMLRTGDRLGGKKVTNFALLGAVPGSPGQRRAWTPGDTAPRVIYRASFSDGSTALVSTVIP